LGGGVAQDNRKQGSEVRKNGKAKGSGCIKKRGG